MCAEHSSDQAEESRKLDANAVVTEAIAAMREDPVAHAAADAIEAAWGEGGFDVERAVRDVEAAENTDRSSDEADAPGD